MKRSQPHVQIFPWVTNGGGIDWSDCGPIHRCGEDFAYCWDYAPLLPFADGAPSRAAAEQPPDLCRLSPLLTPFIGPRSVTP